MTILLKSLTNFPSSVVGNKFIAITKTNGIWTIDPQFQLLNVPVIDDVSKFETVARDTRTDTYGRVPFITLLAAGSLATQVTASRPITAAETYLRVALTAPSTITFGASLARAGLKIGVKDVLGNCATNPLTVAFYGAEAADGQTTLTLNQNFMYLEMIPNTSGWEITHFA